MYLQYTNTKEKYKIAEIYKGCTQCRLRFLGADPSVNLLMSPTFMMFDYPQYITVRQVASRARRVTNYTRERETKPTSTKYSVFLNKYGNTEWQIREERFLCRGGDLVSDLIWNRKRIKPSCTWKPFNCIILVFQGYRLNLNCYSVMKIFVC